MITASAKHTVSVQWLSILQNMAILYKWIPQNFFADLMSYISRGVKVRSGLGLGVRLGLGLGVRLGYGVG